MSLRALATVVVTTVMMLPHAWADTAWESYKSRFMMPDGRIIDTGNGNVSHTEGQGFAMLLAVANNDRSPPAAADRPRAGQASAGLYPPGQPG